MKAADTTDSQLSVLFVSTLSHVYSYGLRILVSLLRNDNIEADLLFVRALSSLDNRFRKVPYRVISKNFQAPFLEFIKPYSIIGFTVYTDNLPECIQLSRLIREHFPEKKIVYGGIHASALPEECLRYADYVCVGEAFISFPESIPGIREGRNSNLAEGIWARNADGTINKNGCGKVQFELDKLPYPSYDPEHTFIRTRKNQIIPMGRRGHIKHLGYSYATMMSMGCPYSCTYCCNNTLKRLSRDHARTRWHSAEYIINEILAAKQNYEFYSVWFMDDSFIGMDDENFERFIIYRDKVNLPFIALGMIPRVLARLDDRLERLIDIGMTRGGVGVQTGSQRMLGIYKRAQSNDEIIRVSRIFSKYRKKARTSYDLILDGVDENTSDIVETIKLINRLERPVLFNMFSLRLYPGTELYETMPLGYRRENSYLDYDPTLGNFVIGLSNFIRIPNFLIQKLSKNPDLVSVKIPKLATKILDLFVLSKRVVYYIFTKDYCRLPWWLARLFLKKSL